MCGITGIIALDNSRVHMDGLKNMTDSVAHRGPDSEGHWISANGSVGLGHRRLSIIDFSKEANQPMHYLDRYTIVFNGEIYNYKELKEILQAEGYSFRTNGDTEVLIALFHRNQEECLQFLDGMFAFVIYDKLKNEIFAARDRFGEKPFFYSYERGKYFYFGSEMKCLWAAGITKEVNNVMLYNYLENNLLSNPQDDSLTFYKNCIRLPHSHFIKLQVSKLDMSIHKYYDIDYRLTNEDIGISEAQEKFHQLFFTSVSRRLRSDAPVGSSLSGGLDSSLVVTTIDSLKKVAGQNQNTFSAVFPGFIKDERKYMDYITAKSNVTPHYITPTDEGLISSLDKLAFHQEEPFGSASIYIQYCVMQLAKENNTTVLLDGQGADEILAGYHAYYPVFFKELKKRDANKYRKEVAAYSALHSGSLINESIKKNMLESALRNAGASRPTLYTAYQKIKNIKEGLMNREFYHEHKSDAFVRIRNFESLNHSLYVSTMQYGLQELLRYADRNSMAHSREVRMPFLSHELVEFLFSLPANMKINDGWTKWIMRVAFSDELPAEIAWRKDKIGFEPPQNSWMNSKVMKERLHCAKGRLVQEGILAKKVSNEQKLKPNSANDWKWLMCQSLLEK